MKKNRAAAGPTFYIDPQGYTGALYLDGLPKDGKPNINTNQGKPFSCSLPSQDHPTSHKLDNGSAISGSYISFDIDNGGNVLNIGNPLSAATNAGTPDTLFLKTALIKIDSGGRHGGRRGKPGRATVSGTYYLTNFPTPGGPFLTTTSANNLSLHLIKCLYFGVDAGLMIRDAPDGVNPLSGFRFHVREDGVVFSLSSAGTGGKGQLTLNSGEITITPPDGLDFKSYKVGLYEKQFTGIGDNIPVVFGLTTSFKVYFKDGNSAPASFCPDYMVSQGGTIAVGDQLFTYKITSPTVGRK